MLKKYKLFTIIFSAIFLLFFIFESIGYYNIYLDESTVLPSTKEHGALGLPSVNIETYIKTYFTNNNKIWSNREILVENENSTKKPILLMGDEVAGGLEMKREEELSFNLATKTGRPVYNRAINCPPMQVALHQLRDDNFYKEVPKPEYLLFTFSRACNIVTHRPYVYSLARFNPSFYYKEKNGVLVEDKIKPYLLRSPAYFWFRMSQVKYCDPTPDMLDLLCLYFIEMRKEVEKHWGKDVKFVVLMYDKVSSVEVMKPVLTYLKEKNFTVIDVNELSDIDFYEDQYLFPPSMWHPNGKAINIYSDLLIKELGL